MTATHATTIDYRTQGTFTASSLNIGGVLVTGSNTIDMLNLNGLGVMGGVLDSRVDGNEYLDFSFSGLGSAIGLSYLVQSANNFNGDGLAGARILSVFGMGGSLLGTFNQDNAGIFDVSTLVSNAPIDHIRLQANVDGFDLSSITFTAQQVAQVPEPATLSLLGLGLAWLGFRRKVAD